MPSSTPPISSLNQLEEDEVLNENPDLTAADIPSLTGPLPDEIAVLEREHEQVKAMQHFILARSSDKRRHTIGTTAIRLAIRNHAAGFRLSKTDLKKKEDELIAAFDRALKSHQSFIDGVPDISDKKKTTCQNWRTQFETDHQMILDEIENHLENRSTTESIASKSAYSSASSKAKEPAKQNVESLTQQLVLVQQQLASQGQQFQNALLAADESRKAAAEKVSSPPNFDALLEKFSTITQQIQDGQRDQNENLRRYIDSTIGRIDSRVDIITNYQTSQKSTVDSLTRFVTDIASATRIEERAKKPNQTLHFDLSHDDSLDANAPQGAKPKVRLSDHETMINTRRGAMGFASTPASKAPTQPNFNLTRVVRDDNVVNNSTHGATTCINDPSYTALDTKTEVPKRNDPSHSRLTDAHRALNPADPLSVIYGEILSTLKMQNVALVPLKPFDGKHLNYKNFKREFFAMYHNRIDDVVVRMTQLRGLLTDNVKAVVSETIDDHDNYDLVWKRLDEEYGYVSMQSQSKISKMLDISPMKSANSKELVTFAQQLHDSVSKLAHGEEVSELSSQGNIRFMMMKLTPQLQIKWGAKCYDALPRVLNLVDMDDWLTKKSKSQQYGKLLCGGVSNDSNESSTRQ